MALLLLPSFVPAAAQAERPATTVAIERRVDALLREMTLEEKVGQLTQYTSNLPETLELVRGSLPPNISLEACGFEAPLMVISDAIQLHQVVTNLCGNAIHAMSGGGTLGVTPGSMSFGSVTFGSTQTQSGSVTASGGGVTLSPAGSSNSVFTLGGFTPPVLAAGPSVPFTVTFAPTTSGTASANVSFFTSSSTSALETASGSGATIQHIADLSWNASTSASITGYNVYRGTISGGPYSKINSALDTSMSYSDSTVQSGQTYYYATTAVDSTGVESSYSNQVQVVVPFP